MILDDLFVVARDHKQVGKRSLVAALYKGHRLVSMGFNNYHKSHPMQKKFGKNDEAIYLHAEIDAIINARCDVRGMTMYIARAKFVNGQWVHGLAKPCKGCAAALKHYGVTAIYTEEQS